MFLPVLRSMHNADRWFRPSVEHTELENELHDTAHIDYDRVAIVSISIVSCLCDYFLTSE